MELTRTKNTISGSMFGFIEKIIVLVFPFIIRTIFIKTIGIEYLGLNGLFSSILQILNLAELGVGSALVFSMYKPIAEDNQEKICALLRLYRKYYRIIGTIILVSGLIIMPFLRFFVKGDIPSDINLYVIYSMHLATTVLNYWLLAYRTSLFQAHQRFDVIVIVKICTTLLQYVSQIILLFVLKNYYFYLLITIVSQLLTNCIIAFLSKKIYKQYDPKGKLDKEEVKTINKKVRDLFAVKISGVITNSFDTVVVSSFLGLVILAIYQNYFYIVSSIIGIIMVFFTSLQAGIGNYLITRSKEESLILFKRINFVTFFIVNFCCSCLITMYQPFMKIWVGNEYMLPFSLVIMFVVYLFSHVLVRPAVVFKDAAGLWREDRLRPLISSLANLILNLATVKWLGLYGVLGSTIISYLFINFPWIIHNINKHLFKIDVKAFIANIFIYAIVIAYNATLCYFLCDKIHFSNQDVDLIVRCILSMSISSILFFTFFMFTKENNYAVKVVKRIFLRSKKQSK